MKIVRLLTIAALLSLASAYAITPQAYAPATKTPSCNAVTTTGACTPLYLTGNSLAIGVTWQLDFDTGTASSVSVTLQGSNDNSLFTTLDTNTSTSGNSRSLVVGTYKYLRCNVGTYSKGTTNNVTCSITSNPNGSPAGEGIISINADTTSAQQIQGAGTVSCATTGGVTTCTGSGTTYTGSNPIGVSGSTISLKEGSGVGNDGSGNLTTVGQQPAQIAAGPMCPSACTNSQVVLYIPITTAITIPAGCTNSKAYSAATATGSSTFQMYDLAGGPTGSSTNFGSFVFAGSGQTGTFTCASQQVLAAGDVLKIVGPSTADATLATIGVNLNGTR